MERWEERDYAPSEAPSDSLILREVSQFERVPRHHRRGRTAGLREKTPVLSAWFLYSRWHAHCVRRAVRGDAADLRTHRVGAIRTANGTIPGCRRLRAIVASWRGAVKSTVEKSVSTR